MMHFEILVEGQTELTTLSFLMKQIVGEYGKPHTWFIHKHRGIGKIPLDLTANPKKNDQTLLHNLPSKLRAYGNECKKDLIVVVLVDLDQRPDPDVYKQELINILGACPLPPNTLFCLAIEEIEAWFLGDHDAILKAYPDAKVQALNGYVQDSQCGTWEALADVFYPGGHSALLQAGTHRVEIVKNKVTWARRISPYMQVERNLSPSFNKFYHDIREKLV